MQICEGEEAAVFFFSIAASTYHRIVFGRTELLRREDRVYYAHVLKKAHYAS